MEDILQAKENMRTETKTTLGSNWDVIKLLSGAGDHTLNYGVDTIRGSETLGMQETDSEEEEGEGEENSSGLDASWGLTSESRSLIMGGNVMVCMPPIVMLRLFFYSGTILKPRKQIC